MLTRSRFNIFFHFRGTRVQEKKTPVDFQKKISSRILFFEAAHNTQSVHAQKTSLKITQHEKMHFIKVNELKNSN